jgi:hypothetical protein
MAFIIILLSALSSIAILILYVWYLFWPVVSGKITDIREGIISSEVRSSKPYKMITLKAIYEGETIIISRQSLWMAGALPAKGLIGKRVRVSVCKYRVFCCPYRPVTEFLVSIAISLFFAFFAFVVWWFYVYLPGI